MEIKLVSTEGGKSKIKSFGYPFEPRSFYRARLSVDGEFIGVIGNDGTGGEDVFEAHKVSEDDDWGWTENMGAYLRACEWVAEQMPEDSDLKEEFTARPEMAMTWYAERVLA